MKRLVGFPMESGENICDEVEGPRSASGTTRPVRVVGRRAGAESSFEDALEKAQPTASPFSSRFRSVAEPSDEVQAEFGLTLNARSGPGTLSTRPATEAE